jgi:hypothetical protein
MRIARVWLAAAAFALSACGSPFSFNHTPSAPLATDATRGPADGLPFPSKDEVLLVNGRAFSLSDFYLVRSRLRSPALKKANTVIWAGTAALLLEENAQIHGKTTQPAMASPDALLIARYALADLEGPETQKVEQSLKVVVPEHLHLSSEQVHGLIDAWIAQAKIEKNPQILAELR